jgi:hypothetical protein
MDCDEVLFDQKKPASPLEALATRLGMRHGFDYNYMQFKKNICTKIVGVNFRNEDELKEFLATAVQAGQPNIKCEFRHTNGTGLIVVDVVEA